MRDYNQHVRKYDGKHISLLIFPTELEIDQRTKHKRFPSWIGTDEPLLHDKIDFKYIFHLQFEQ